MSCTIDYFWLVGNPCDLSIKPTVIRITRSRDTVPWKPSFMVIVTTSTTILHPSRFLSIICLHHHISITQFSWLFFCSVVALRPRLYRCAVQVCDEMSDRESRSTINTVLKLPFSRCIFMFSVVWCRNKSWSPYRWRVCAKRQDLFASAFGDGDARLISAYSTGCPYHVLYAIPNFWRT